MLLGPGLLLAASISLQSQWLITLDGSGSGQVFQGVGGISAGGTSRLLKDYPEPSRSQILDFLFKPNFGASLQHLKVEIGGDENSGDGAEPTHMRSPSDQNYSRGYEFWLMQQASTRRPGIPLDALEWGVPGWIGGGQFYSQDNINYILNFIQGAQNTYSLPIDYIGIWDETPYDTTWIKGLKAALQAAGLSTKIVAADLVDGAQWMIANDMLADSALMAAVDIIGAHYPDASSSPEAQATGKPLWDSEEGPWRGDWPGAQSIAQALLRNYPFGRMTKTEIWALVTAYYDLPSIRDAGLMLANTPWSGNFTVQPAIWAVAHVTQFAQPGWQFIDSACGSLLGGVGNYITLLAPNGTDYSTILETKGAYGSQTITFSIKNGLSTGTVHVWKSDANAQFVKWPDITPVGGQFSIALEADAIYSLTTTTGQNKGSVTPPAPAAFPFPFVESFDEYAAGSTPQYFSDYAGAFETAACAAARDGLCLRQVVTAPPIAWPGAVTNEPMTFVGDITWTNYQESVDSFFEQPGSCLKLYGRVSGIAQKVVYLSGYELDFNSSGAWSLEAGPTLLASGTIPAPSLNSWHTLAMIFNGSQIQGVIDGTTVVNLNDATFSSGMGGLGSNWANAQFDNFLVGPLPGVNPVSVTPPAVALGPAQTQQFTASVFASNNQVVWSLTPNTGTITASGLYTAPTSVSTAQTVTVTATSVQDTTKSASATVTLTPPTVSAIIQQPQSVIVAIGQTATFVVTATGFDLSYQWQSMPPGASSFSPISGAVSSSYTTPATVAGDDGTQFLCVVSAGPQSITSSAALLSVQGTAFVQTSPTLALRNNFTGWVGMNLTIGGNAATVTALGRMCVAGNSGVHTAKFASPGGDVAGGSTQINMSGCVPGQFVYSILANPLTLPPNTTYYLATQELSGGDQWYDWGPVSTTADALVNSSAYSSDGVKWIPYGTANTSYVPPNFLYTVALSPPPGPDLMVSMSHSGNFAIGDIGQNYTITVSNSGGVATSGVVSLTDSVPNGLVATGIVGSGWDCTQPAGPCSRSDPLAAHSSYLSLTLTVNVSANTPGIVTNSATAAGGGEVETGNDTATDPIVTAQANASIFLTSYSQTSSMLRNNFTGWAGLQLTVGSQPLSAVAIGRICVAGNSGTHAAKLVSVATGADVAGSTVPLNMAGCTGGQFVYAALSASITLPANTSYYLVTQELSGGDQWYDHGAVSSTGDAAVGAAVYSFDSVHWTQATSGNTAYVPPNLQYLVVPATMIDVEVQAAISGAAFTVDGTQYTSPRGFNWLAGSSHNVSAPSPQSAGVGTEYVFSSWSDGGANSHSISPVAATTLTASFSTQYLLTATVAAPGGGSISANPSSTRGYYVSGTQVQLTAVPNSGCTFSGWSGAPNGAVTMSGPQTVSATFVCSGPTATNFVTAYALNNPVLRNNFSGWVGMEITVGANPINVSALGRIVVAGNTGTHQVKFVQASSGADVSAGSTLVSTAGQTAGQFSYQPLTAPITLQPFTTYNLVSAEVNGGDQWYDHGTISTSSAAAVNSSVYYTGSAWAAESSANTSYVPVDFQYTLGTAAPNTVFVTGYNLNNRPLRNNFTGWVGMAFTVGAAGMTVNSLGRVFVAGNSGTHTVKLVSASTGADVPGASVTVSMAGGIPGQFSYTDLMNAVTLTPNASYYLVSEELSGGDQWYDYATIATSPTGTVTGAVYSFDGVDWLTIAQGAISYVPPNLK